LIGNKISDKIALGDGSEVLLLEPVMAVPCEGHIGLASIDNSQVQTPIDLLI
jgi:hypothetical protein